MRNLYGAGLIAITLALATGCGGDSNKPAGEPGGAGGTGGGSLLRIDAGGATFVNPIMQKWSGAYKDMKKAEINYVQSGSGDGIKGVTKKNLDFACSDAPMDAKEVKAAKEAGGDVIHIPVAIGAVALVYNLDGVKDLKLSGEVLGEIYMRKITKWNDPKIAALNPGVPLPDQPVTPVARDASSGTTSIFTEYLKKRNDALPKASKSPKWPEGVEKKKENAGIAEYVKSTPFTIGYVELAFARNNNLPCASIVNKAGKPVAPGAASVTAAVDAAIKVKPTEEPYSLHPLAFSFTDADGAGAYPIVGASYAMLFQNQPKEKGTVIVEFLKWVVTDGQKMSADLHYAPLPAELSNKAKELLGTVLFG
jgi:phosphate transport system substrate-binding protein